MDNKKVDHMPVGLNEIFDEVVRYLKKAYPNCCEIKLTYLELADFDDEHVFRGEVEFDKNENEETISAIFQANPDGNITFFREEYGW